MESWRGPVIDWAPALVVSLAFGLLVFNAYLIAGGNFDAPDDASNYATAQALVDHGRPWLEIPYGLDDSNDLLHQRGFTTTDRGAVPIQPIHTPALHAAVWRASGTFALSAGLFAMLGLLGWAFAARVIGRAPVRWTIVVRRWRCLSSSG